MELLREKQAAEALTVTVAALRRWRRERRGPRWFRLGGKAVRYDRADLEAFVKASAEGPSQGGRRIAAISR